MKQFRESRSNEKKEKDKARNKEAQRKDRSKQLLENPDQYRQSVAQNKANSRKNNIMTEEGRRTLI